MKLLSPSDGLVWHIVHFVRKAALWKAQEEQAQRQSGP